MAKTNGLWINPNLSIKLRTLTLYILSEDIYGKKKKLIFLYINKGVL